jgi:hypothetical protein
MSTGGSPARNPNALVALIRGRHDSAKSESLLIKEVLFEVAA